MVDLLTRRTQLLYVNHSMVSHRRRCRVVWKGKRRNPDSMTVAPRSRVLLSHRNRSSNEGEEGTRMQPHSARWACRNHMAAMTKAAEAFRVLRETVLNDFCASAALNDALHSGHILHSAYALKPAQQRQNWTQIRLELTSITLFG